MNHRPLDVLDLFLLPVAWLMLNLSLICIRASRLFLKVANVVDSAALRVARTTREEAERGSADTASLLAIAGLLTLIGAWKLFNTLTVPPSVLFGLAVITLVVLGATLALMAWTRMLDDG